MKLINYPYFLVKLYRNFPEQLRSFKWLCFPDFAFG